MPSFFPDAAASGHDTDVSGNSASRDGGALAVALDDASYPARLRELRAPPAVVYTRGTFATATPPAVAIVGTRAATPYGLRVAAMLATACVRAGVCVVSGLARGIDGAAHEAALRAGGRTVAVLGTGPDLYYPRQHRWLQERIAAEGLVLSEFPPGSTGHRGAFPQRNRLIAALADVTVVVEAPIGSGALLTADFAQELGREIAVVPNAIDEPRAAGSNALLRDAHPILSAEDLLALVAREASPPALPTVSGSAADVWDALGRGIDTVPGLAAHTGLGIPAVQGALGLLEIDGLVVFDAAGRVRRLVS